MRLIGWLLLLSGLWSLWHAFVAREPLGWGGILMTLVGLGLLTPAGRAFASWIGQGLLTGLSITLGVGFLAVGLVGLGGYFSLPAEAGAALPALVTPLLFVGWGLLLLLLGIRRLLRQYQAF